MHSSSPDSEHERDPKHERPDHAAEGAAERCAEAAEAAARCSRTCLAHPRVYELEECIEWCLLSSEVLGSCSHVLTRRVGDGRSLAVVAAAEAGLMAAVGCEEALREESSAPECADLADRCADAARALREFLQQVSLHGSRSLDAVAS